MKIGVMGLPYHAKILCEQLNQEGIDAFLIEISISKYFKGVRQADIIHSYSTPISYKAFAIAKLLNRKVVHHWIGSDVLRVLQDKRLRLKAKIANRFVDKHFALSPYLVDELSSVGIESICIPAVPRNLTFETPPLPQRLTVLTYLPDKKPGFYGSKIIYKLAEELRDAKFLVVAGTGEGQQKLPNVEYLGWVTDMVSIYHRSSALVRILEHDGQSLMVLEALAKGRHVIYNYQIPHCHYATDFEGALEILERIKSNPEVNVAGSEFVRTKFNQKTIIGNIKQIYDSLLTK